MGFFYRKSTTEKRDSKRGQIRCAVILSQNVHRYGLLMAHQYTVAVFSLEKKSKLSLNSELSDIWMVILISYLYSLLFLHYLPYTIICM